MKDLSGRKAYLYCVGLFFAFIEINRSIILWVWRHITEVLIGVTFAAMFVVPNFIDSGTISYACGAVFMIILICLFTALIRIKLLEVRSENNDSDNANRQ